MNKTVINQHRSIAKSDVNHAIEVTGTGTESYKVVFNPDSDHCRQEQTVKFHHFDKGMPPGLYPIGLTNEVLLAIVADRLYQFQGGQCACEENAIALQQVNGALAALKARTVRRSNQGIEGTMVESPTVARNQAQPPHLKGRVVREAYTVWVDGKAYDADEVAVIMNAISQLRPPIQPHEIPDNCLLTDRLKAFKDTKMAEDKEDKPRVRMEGDTLFIGALGFQPDALKVWRNWNDVEAACKRLDPSLTSAEMEIIEKAAAHLGGGARNGLAEFKSAMASTRKA